MSKLLSRREFVVVSSLAAAMSSMPARAQKAQRSRALILAQSYRYDGRLYLPNTSRDASLIQQTFQQLKFHQILTLQDQPASLTLVALGRFLGEIAKDDLVVVYLAGHGVEIGGENLLMLNGGEQFISLQTLVETLQNLSRTVVVFLDACRNNPYDGIPGSGQVSRSLISRSAGLKAAPIRVETVQVAELRQARREETRQLRAFSLTGSGIKIVFSTDPFNVALDGAVSTSVNSPFAQALSRRMLERRSLDDVIAMTTGDVLKATGRSQSPWSQGSIDRPLFLAGPPVQRNPARPRFQVPG
jgi:uncharacterized caspase-like protein